MVGYHCFLALVLWAVTFGYANRKASEYMDRDGDFVFVASSYVCAICLSIFWPGLSLLATLVTVVLCTPVYLLTVKQGPYEELL